MMVRAAGGWVVLSRVRRRSADFQHGVWRGVRIADVTTPLTCGVLRPLILLPQAARDWDESRLWAVLLHESAHVRRRDCMAKYLAQAARALYWWNPLAWMLATRLNHEQELACDDAVLAAGVPAGRLRKCVVRRGARVFQFAGAGVRDGSRQRRRSSAGSLHALVRVATASQFARPEESP